MTSTQEDTRPIPLIGPMLATIDRGDLETTVRTLEEITRRARGIPARPTATEDHR